MFVQADENHRKHPRSYSSSHSGCYQGWQELRNYQKFGTFTVTVEDAKEYLYSFSARRRVYKFHDIKVNLYI